VPLRYSSRNCIRRERLVHNAQLVLASPPAPAPALDADANVDPLGHGSLRLVGTIIVHDDLSSTALRYYSKLTPDRQILARLAYVYGWPAVALAMSALMH